MVNSLLEGHLGITALNILKGCEMEKKNVDKQKLFIKERVILGKGVGALKRREL